MMKRVIGFGLGMVATMMMSSVTLAAGYGTAGCGLGSILLGDSKGIMQIFAATTNGTSGNQTFGITSGTSNCTDAGGGSESAKAFIESNRESLAKDIARGEGESIEGLAALAGCEDTAAVGQSLQSQFDVIFPNASVADTTVSDTMIDVLRQDAALACQGLGQA